MKIYIIIYITIITYYFLHHIQKYKLKLLTVLFSCDRSNYLNITITTFYNHIHYYEPNIISNFHFVDSGTINRLEYVKQFKIKNIFFLNPTDPELTYNMFWTYLHGGFVLFLEDDRPFNKNIEKYIIYPNFIEESILILRKTNEVKGILLRNKDGISSIKYIKTYLGNHILWVIKYPSSGFYYINSPAIYNIKYLKKTNYFNSEKLMNRKFRKLKWYTGITFKGLKCKSNKTSAACQGVSYHLGKTYSTKSKRNICKVYMF